MTLDDNTKFRLLEAEVADGRQIALPLRGKSMLPLLREGCDMVVLGPVAQPPKRGRIYLFRHEGKYRLHRLTKRVGEELVFRGDNAVAVERVSPTSVVAELLAVSRKRRTFGCYSLGWRCRSSASWLFAQAKLAARTLAQGSVRKRVAPWYIAAVVVLMWAPLNGLGVPLDNFVLGIRADHLVHASVYLPVAFFLAALCHFRAWPTLLLAVAMGICTECGQYLLPFRSFDINDMIANFLGVLLGWSITRVFDNRHPSFRAR